jgi:hypothetical protein
MKGDNCACIAINHDQHEPGECDEPEPVTGTGSCPACRYHVRTDPSSDVALKAEGEE